MPPLGHAPRHLLPHHRGPQGHPAPEGLGQGEDVGDDAEVLKGEALPRAAHSGLDLVQDEEGPLLLGDLPGGP